MNNSTQFGSNCLPFDVDMSGFLLILQVPLEDEFLSLSGCKISLYFNVYQGK